ncbi:MAG: hypothetical protein A3F42_03115 [Gammaproteobacteria bacterium RIFCSPHIGHO2_12_FULL_37_34]|nr:MAG: hypothetical protein A3F42_03115 [Gammaproteobacteria bacterium RIFCSPHIGHO2_12_FULL_37_34]
MLTTPKASPSYPIFLWHDLQSAHFNFNTPFMLHLADKQVFFVEQVLRIIPKKRMVVLGVWQDKPVVAKLFFNLERAKQHIEKDVAGINILQTNHIPTPTILHQSISEDRRIYILILERIFEAENLATIWEAKKHHVPEILSILKSVVTEIATQHVLGVLQQDIHFKNFLLTTNRIYTLDGAQIEIFKPLLPKQVSIKNLALFLAQLGVGAETLQKQLFQYYATLRGWRLKKEDDDELFYQINKRNNKRWQQFEKKIFRDCSDFSRFHDLHIHGMYNRVYQSAALLQFLKNPDAIFHHPTTQIIKMGRSATVAKIAIDHHTFIIKRYNIKSIWHQLRRSMRLTRAYVSWRLAQKCMLLGVSTAKPVAFIEKKYFGLRNKSYFISEFVSGEHVGDFFKKNHIEDEVSKMAVRIMALLKNITKIELTHGDLKTTNILIDQYKQPVLIDLDGATEHTSLSGLYRAFRKDMKRFFKNFDGQLLLKKKFQEIL